MITDAVDDFSGSVGIPDDTGERFPDLPGPAGSVQKRMAARALLRAVAIGCRIS